ncbi:P-loop containing nucleoside triphosphate hydrolase protein [Thelonectria olida]|uniref:P-loop containing nucleoside triphosphate hydrolase protein n=1 Tax=Thelonectria olida TaxID=1576542 RepID=A0A9P9ATS5_9HYPO|nr:P-loop containing nucleoside triphosphate hydrolase protein [Thelonectria olida]
MATKAKEVIDLIDDEDTSSDHDDDIVLVDSTSASKRKLDSDFSEKVIWTDDDDDLPQKPKKHKAKRKAGRKKKKRNNDAVHGEVDEPEDELELAGIPEYLQERRRQFDANRKLHHDAALMLPPDYSGIYFEESSRLGELEERPKFDEASGVKPSRPYKDIELPQSAGLIPASIAQYLRDYQVAGVAFLHRKFVYQEGGILGDDMGLGKTVQVAAFLTAAFGKTGDERDAKRMRHVCHLVDRWYPRILVICPGSLIANWRNELNRWGWWHVDIFHGANKDDVLGTARAGRLEIMITTYDTYKNSRSSINMVQWDAVICDECHRLKDRYSETTKALNEVNALCRLGLTGTAIQNKYEELWTLLDWTNPGQFGTIAEWKQTVSKPLTVGQSHDATVSQLSLARQTAKKLVNNLLPRYFLRRMKTLIAHQMPKKTDRVVFCPLTGLQREAYENFLNSYEVRMLRAASEPCCDGKKKGWCCGALLPNGQRWQSVVFPSMNVLQKLANHLTLLIPQTTDLAAKHDSDLRTLQTCMPEDWQGLYDNRDLIKNLVNSEYCGKWMVLKMLLKFWYNNGDKVLVFSHSVRLLRILQHLLTNTSYTVSYLDGSLSYEQRQEVVDTFNSDPTQFAFLISTKAGGVGLNITSANKVVIVDPHWNPSYDLQAQDRAYRIGQTRDVEVFRLITLGTIEEIVYARQIYKQQQANIGYTASSERRYFKGVQQDTERKGEIFGLSNIFSYHNESGLLQDIVNKTNIAEAKAGVNLVDVDMEQAAKDEEFLGTVKQDDGDGEDGGMSQLAALVTAQNQNKMVESKKKQVLKTDAVQAILTSAGVEYTHDNSEVIGTSKVEEQLSRRAEMTLYSEGDVAGQNALFADSDEEDGDGLHGTFNPPEDVRLRQFCEMARTFGFVNATEFALVVENWTQEARRNCLDAFYKKREAKLISEGLVKFEEKKEVDEKVEIKSKEEMADDILKLEASFKEEDVKGEIKDEIKGEIKDEIKDEDIKSEDVKPHRFKTEETKMRIPLKSEAMDLDDKKLIKTEDKKVVKIEGSSKRNSIFLSDDDDDDDEL